ncbi:phospholipase b-like [Anaeramoeba flamelloides]|uniref:Phospholipase b-like n=1 Tax=Anaeramoeba flamelloides TaxID=1746091 RepID=A0AAV7YG23_9EUKA|nr:phospholipase b-like [Anaeramoeba flamelloides]
MKKLVLFVIFFGFLFTLYQCSPIYGAVYYDSKTNTRLFSNKLDLNGVATGMENDQVDLDGFEKVVLKTSSSNEYTDLEKSYGIGLLEGILTSDRITQVYQNWMKMRYPHGIPDQVAGLSGKTLLG